MNIRGYIILLKGRIDGSDKTRKQNFSAGKVPLQTIDSKIDYALDVANTRYGLVSVKTWICLGDIK
jgi:small subunit ribosomal protein S3